MAQLQTEVFVSIDGEIFNKIDLAKNESIQMKYVLKDTSDLSKIFSPFSLSFTFPGTLNNQRIFGFIGNTKVYKPYSSNVFACKIYSNGLLLQTGKLKLTEVREDNGRVKSFTANFTTTMLSLTSRMGDDKINDLPDTPVEVSWLPNDVFNSVSSIKYTPTDPSIGIRSKYYVPLISRNRIFQRRVNTSGVYLDNVAYVAGADPLSTKTIKTTELRPAIQGRTIIDLIKKKYNLDVEMPLEQTAEYNDWYIYCNAAIVASNKLTTVDMTSPLTLEVTSQQEDPDSGPLPPFPRYNTSLNLSTNVFTVTIDDSFGTPDRWNGHFQLNIRLNGVIILDDAGTSDFLVTVKRVSDERLLFNNTVTSIGNSCLITTDITDAMFESGTMQFTIEIAPKQTSSWVNMDVWTKQEYYNHTTILTVPQISRREWQYASVMNNNSAASGGGTIDLFKALPETKCTDFLNSFFKTFNISVFDASPSDDKLFWLTPKDLLVNNKAFSKKVSDYTEYIVSNEVNKTIAADYNYYNFKHKTSKYKSNADYLAAHGLEFGQTTWPTVKPTSDLNEFKVETGFCILEALPIAGMADEFTCYGFTNEAPDILETGEKRYKPNNDDLTMFFSGGLRALSIMSNVGGIMVETSGKLLGFQKTLSNGSLTTGQLKSYIKTTPIHPNGFSFGFGLIQEATVRSLYYDFYKIQTERLLSPNTLQQSYKLQLPASELILNYATTTQGQSNVPDGFRLQNEIILQEQRFSIIDAQIDITTGKTNINLLNF